MRREKTILPKASTVGGTLLTIIPIVMVAAASQPTLTTLHNFTGHSGDGEEPTASLVIGPGGVLYGTTSVGGTSRHGTVFSLTPPGSPGGSWIENVFDFPGGAGGATPYGGVVIGADGMLYGTTEAGGTSGFGTVFSLKPPASPGGSWTEEVLYSFTSGSPYAGVVIGPGGVLYGTTLSSVFSLTPPSSPGGSWTETVLHYFAGADGVRLQAGVVFGGGGVLYATASDGGVWGDGAVFSLTPPTSPDGSWTETVLWNFKRPEGYQPDGGVVIDSAGVLYGTTYSGGSAKGGTVFSLTPPAAPGGSWTQTLLYNLHRRTGSHPAGNLIIGRHGVLVGTTSTGSPAGTIFSLRPPVTPSGPWTEHVLWRFSSNSDGDYPLAGLVVDGDGIFYGTTFGGGTSGEGTAFSLVP